MFAKINENVFNRRDVCLVINQNSISYVNFGCAADIVAKYPYADVAGLRRPDNKLQSYSDVSYHDQEGNAIIKSPAEDDVGPSITTLITQYGIGRAYEDNNIAHKIVKCCRDTTIMTRLTNDTKDTRLSNFNKSVFQLGNHLTTSNFSHIQKIVFPVGIGRSGKLDMIWLCRYLPVIYAFARDMKKILKQVVLVMSPKCNELDWFYESRQDYAEHFYRMLKNLPILNKSEFLCDLPLPNYSPISNDGEDLPDTQYFYTDV